MTPINSASLKLWGGEKHVYEKHYVYGTTGNREIRDPRSFIYICSDVLIFIWNASGGASKQGENDTLLHPEMDHQSGCELSTIPLLFLGEHCACVCVHVHLSVGEKECVLCMCVCECP